MRAAAVFALVCAVTLLVGPAFAAEEERHVSTQEKEWQKEVANRQDVHKLKLEKLKRKEDDLRKKMLAEEDARDAKVLEEKRRKEAEAGRKLPPLTMDQLRDHVDEETHKVMTREIDFFVRNYLTPSVVGAAAPPEDAPIQPKSPGDFQWFDRDDKSGEDKGVEGEDKDDDE